jgi:uncharacterized protein with HEPN domain
MRREEAHLLDIVNAANHITDFVQGLDLEGFRTDFKTQAAVLHQIIVIGEAASRLGDDFVAMHADIPWHEIRSMRNRLVQEYHRVDVSMVWTVVEKEIPPLVERLVPLLPEKP